MFEVYFDVCWLDQSESYCYFFFIVIYDYLCSGEDYLLLEFLCFSCEVLILVVDWVE